MLQQEVFSEILELDLNTSFESDSTFMAECVNSILKSSDEVAELFVDESQDLICETCREFGTLLPADGYCVDCKEFLCEVCVSHHRTPRPFKHHMLKSKHDMPMRNSEQFPSGYLLKRCQLHPDKGIISYCKTHDQLCCETCVSIGHMVCPDLNSIHALGADIETDSEFLEFSKKLNRLYKSFIQCNSPGSDHSQTEDVTSKQYDEIIAAFHEKIESIRAKDSAMITQILEILTDAQKQINDWTFKVVELMKDKEYGQLYILMKRTQQYLESITENVDKTCQNINITKYVFSFPLKTDSSDLGVLKLVPFTVDKIYVKHSDDQFGCVIRDILLLNEDHIIVADYGGNCCVKLINIKDKSIVSSLKLNSGPWQMTLADSGQVYVTQPSAKKLLCLRSPTMELGDIKEIHVREKCCAVEYYIHTLRLQCIEPCKLLELDLDGNVQNVIHPDISKEESTEEGKFMSHPYYSVMDRSTGSMFVSCYHRNSIAEITSDGHVRLVLKSEELASPSGLSLESDGSVLVCSKKEKCVLKVTKDGKLEKFLPEKLRIKPSSIAFDLVRRQLFVGGSGSYVYIYNL